LKCYAKSFKKFLDRGGVIGWGIIPTWYEAVGESNIEQLMEYQEGVWETLVKEGIDRDQLLAQSLLTPVRCCLVNPDRSKTVTLAYAWLKEMSHRLREKYRLE
jgi:hypothetical protein